MKSAIAIIAPFLLVLILAGVLYMLRAGKIDEMLEEPARPPEAGIEKSAEPETMRTVEKKLSEADISHPIGLVRARDLARKRLEIQKQEEKERLIRESEETKRKQRLEKSVEGWLKRTER